MRDDLPHAMRETASRLDPDVGRLAAGGVSRGTRMRRIERAVQILGSAVAVAVVFAGVTLFGAQRGTGPGGGERGASQPAESRGESAGSGLPSMPGTPTATTPPTPTTAKTPTPTDTTQVTITRAQLVATLKSCLNGTGVTGGSYTATGTDTSPTTTVVYRGTIRVDARLSTAKNVGFLSIAFSGHQSQAPAPGTPTPLTDGAVVYVSQGTGTSDGRHPDRIDLQVTLVRPDGSSLSALETNSPTPKDAEDYPGAPLLLNSSQLVTMLESSAWDGALAAADAQPATDAAVPGPVTTSPSFTSPS